MRTHRWVLVAAVAAVLIGLAMWWALSPPAVRVAAARRGDLTAALAATGIVEAAQANLAPKVVGRIEALLVDEGDPVRRGQLLGRLDDTAQRAALLQRQAALAAAEAEVARIAAALDQERAQSKARIARAEAAEKASRARLQELQSGARPQELESAQQTVAASEGEQQLAASDFARVSALFEEGAVSQAEVDAARTRLTSARAALRTARENLALLEEGPRAEQIAAAQADLGAAEAQVEEARAANQVAVLEKSLAAGRAGVEQARAAVAAADEAFAETQLLAPISGHVGRRYLDVGDLTGPQSPIFLLADNQKTWVAAEVDEEDVDLVRRGQQVAVSAEALPSSVPGTVAEVGAIAVSRGLQQVRAKIVRCKVILGEGAELLRPGMEVDVSASSTLASDVLLVPTDALNESDGDTFVWLVADGAARRRPVEVGHHTYEQAAIISGLRVGDLVVVESEPDLTDGRRVKPVPAEPDDS